MQQVKIDEFIALAQQYPVLDVRSPGEYSHAHIPSAYSLPLFTDEERKVVGTAYKQQSREDAIKTGLDYFGVKMRGMVEAVEQIVQEHKTGHTTGPQTVLVHCWRGGMRSAGVAWLLGLYGFRVYTLAGGYKSFRNWVLAQFGRPYPFKVIGGYTGAGKTYVLHELAKTEAVIDLEGIARHKGSAFGGLGQEPQPKAEMFENLLAMQLHAVCGKLAEGSTIWIEDESRRIGDINLPAQLWETMQAAPVYFLDIPFEDRLSHIVAEYGQCKKEELVNAIIRIQKRLGGQNTKNAIGHLIENDCKECFGILLAYYDKFYEKGLKARRETKNTIVIKCSTVDAVANSKLILSNVYG